MFLVAVVRTYTELVPAARLFRTIALIDVHVFSKLHKRDQATESQTTVAISLVSFIIL